MTVANAESGFAQVGEARLYYEVAGAGTPFVMIHAGVADSRQWDNEFAAFATAYRVVRYDKRGFGRSEPVEEEYTDLQDLRELLDRLALGDSAVMMGCSMGGGLAMDFTLERPDRVKALIMVSSGPGGLRLDVPELAEFEEAEGAYKAGDLDRVAELETHIWFDGVTRNPDEVNPTMRALAYDMNRLALAHDAKRLGKRLPDTKTLAAERLNELKVPLLVIVGEHDEPYSLAA
ncbi:MAG: alpha/beta hydrolase, partial [Thermoplasmata archaeon]|nr:alpha/beta hydrolase [Thermoplasmata archaeon]